MSHTPRQIDLNMPIEVGDAGHQMLWNRCAHWADCQPDKAAIVTPRAAFTYFQLNQTISRVAAAVVKVRKQTPGGQLRVLLLFADPFGQVAAMIGVEKAGACQVPLSCGSPLAFLSQIAADVEPGLIITEPQLAERARGLVPTDVPVLTLDGLSTVESEGVAPGASTLDDLHCILYTSGSTGRAKGVMRSRFFEAYTVARDMGSGLTRRADRVLCAAAITSGFGYRLVRNALVVGATTYIPDLHGDWLTPARRWLESDKITFLGLPPSLLRSLFGEDAANRQYEHLEIISTGGEAVLESDFELFKRRCLPGALFNVIYAASEGGMYSVEFLTHDSAIKTPVIPLGKLLGFVEMSIVDERMNLLSPGEVGEIIIRSPITADGYWKMPELTAQRFRPDPDGGRRRIYRTGDAGTISSEGTIQFLGRLDHEVKVNGNRVSLELVENTLSGFPGILNVTVQSHARDGDGNAFLTGYYVVPADRAPSPAALRDYLRERLPNYMVPAHLIRLDAIPVNANGKVDRFALRKPDETERTEQSFVAPRTDAEKKIAAIWSSILGIKEVGVEDRFIDLGGDSLQAVRMLIQVNQALGTSLEIPALNQGRTVAELAGLIASHAETRRYPPFVQLREGSGTSLFLFHAIGGTVWQYQGLAERLAGNWPIYGILAVGLSGDEKPLADVSEIARRHIQQIKSLQSKGPYFIGGHSFGGILAFEIARQLREAGDAIGLLLVIDARVQIAKNTTAGEKLRERIGSEIRRGIYHLTYFATHAPSTWPRYVKQLMRHMGHSRHMATLAKQHEAGFEGQIARYLEEIDQIATPAVQAVIDTHRLAVSRYRPTPYTGDVVIALAEQVNFERLSWKKQWREAVNGNLHFITVPGDHLSIMRRPHVDELAKQLNPILAAALGPV